MTDIGNVIAIDEPEVLAESRTGKDTKKRLMNEANFNGSRFWFIWLLPSTIRSSTFENVDHPSLFLALTWACQCPDAKAILCRILQNNQSNQYWGLISTQCKQSKISNLRESENLIGHLNFQQFLLQTQAKICKNLQFSVINLNSWKS